MPATTTQNQPPINDDDTNPQPPPPPDTDNADKPGEDPTKEKKGFGNYIVLGLIALLFAAIGGVYHLSKKPAPPAAVVEPPTAVEPPAPAPAVTTVGPAVVNLDYSDCGPIVLATDSRANCTGRAKGQYLLADGATLVTCQCAKPMK